VGWFTKSGARYTFIAVAAWSGKIVNSSVVIDTGGMADTDADSTQFNAAYPGSIGAYATLKNTFEALTDVDGRLCPLN
jgi:hypothetical protein